VIAVSQDARDVGQLRDTAVQGDDDLSLALVKQGKEVGEDHLTDDLRPRFLDGKGVGQLNKATLIFERLW